MQAADVARAYRDKLEQDEDAVGTGYSRRHARRILQTSLEQTALIPPEERERLRQLPPPSRPGTQQHRALQLRLQGLPFREVGDLLGVDEDVACRYFHAQLRRLLGAAVRDLDAVRVLELVRLERLQAALWPKAVGGDAGAAETVLKIVDRRCRLIGLYGPVTVDMEPRLRQMARAEGLDEDEIVLEARRFAARLDRARCREV
jgi:hypothetical protein